MLQAAKYSSPLTKVSPREKSPWHELAGLPLPVLDPPVDPVVVVPPDVPVELLPPVLLLEVGPELCGFCGSFGPGEVPPPHAAANRTKRNAL